LDKTEIPPHCFVTGTFMLGQIWSKLVRINKVLTRKSSAQRMDKQSVGLWQGTQLQTCFVKQISDAGNLVIENHGDVLLAVVLAQSQLTTLAIFVP